jgi:predicted transposase YbfD/YdcC
LDIIILSIVAIICGAESYESIELFGKENISFLKQILSLKNGIPSHDTIRRIFMIINPLEFERRFMQWSQNLKDTGIIEKVIAIDGKTNRGTKDSFHHQSPAHLLHAWSVENGICLGQVSCSEKSNEITAIPQLLDMLDIRGLIVTIDAMGTQREIANKIIENGADYILAVKGNQKGLLEDVIDTCTFNKPVADNATLEKGHGRIETRRCLVFENEIISDDKNNWRAIKSIIKIISTREIKGKIETQERFYISSLSPENDFNKHIRSHWAVENNLHWTLDMVFREDQQRKRAGHAAKNFAIARKFALNFLKKDTSKGSLVTKRLRAAWSKNYLIDILKF